jgi:predicted site-specific integrase-resolvase
VCVVVPHELALQNQAIDTIELFWCRFLMHNEGMIYGYARVSTDAQDLSSQVAQLKAAGCATIFREKISGATAERPQLKKLMAKLAAGDVVVIPAVTACRVTRRISW